MGWGKAIKSSVKAERGRKKKDRSRGDSTHQNKEKYLETLAEETRPQTEKYAESMGRGRRRKRIRCTGSAGEGGWFSASGGNDGRELPCRPGELQGQIKMVWDRDSPSAFSKTSLNIWKFTVHILLKPGLENFEHYFTTV